MLPLGDGLCMCNSNNIAFDHLSELCVSRKAVGVTDSNAWNLFQIRFSLLGVG